MAAFSGFFSFQMMNTGIFNQQVIYIVISALLLICSPIALFHSCCSVCQLKEGLFSSAVNLIKAPASSNSMHCKKVRTEIGRPLMKPPSFSWQTEQQLWSGFSKYRSYLFCLPLFLAILAGTAVSLAVIPIAGLVIVYYLQKQDGGLKRRRERQVCKSFQQGVNMKIPVI